MSVRTYVWEQGAKYQLADQHQCTLPSMRQKKADDELCRMNLPKFRWRRRMWICRCMNPSLVGSCIATKDCQQSKFQNFCCRDTATYCPEEFQRLAGIANGNYHCYLKIVSLSLESSLSLILQDTLGQQPPSTRLALGSGTLAYKT